MHKHSVASKSRVRLRPGTTLQVRFPFGLTIFKRRLNVRVLAIFGDRLASLITPYSDPNSQYSITKQGGRMDRPCQHNCGVRNVCTNRHHLFIYFAPINRPSSWLQRRQSGEQQWQGSVLKRSWYICLLGLNLLAILMQVLPCIHCVCLCTQPRVGHCTLA